MQGYLSGNPAPTQLFSHNDQEGLWHLGTADAARRYGWGGLALDALGPVGSVPPCISVAGSSRFEIGMSVFPYSLSSAIGMVAPLLAGVLYAGIAHSAPYWLGLVMMSAAALVLARARFDCPSRRPAGSRAHDAQGVAVPA